MQGRRTRGRKRRKKGQYTLPQRQQDSFNQGSLLETGIEESVRIPDVKKSKRRTKDVVVREGDDTYYDNYKFIRVHRRKESVLFRFVFRGSKKTGE